MTVGRLTDDGVATGVEGCVTVVGVLTAGKLAARPVWIRNVPRTRRAITNMVLIGLEKTLAFIRFRTMLNRYPQGENRPNSASGAIAPRRMRDAVPYLPALRKSCKSGIS